MKRHLSFIFACLLLSAIAASAKPIGHTAEVQRPFDQVYQSMSTYFAPDSMHGFRIVTMSKAKSKARIVATRTIKDPIKWRDWTYCKVPALQLLDTLQGGDVTVTVKMDSAGAHHTYVTVTPDFHGTYTFGGSSNTQQCDSRGVLEKDILRGAGATAAEIE
jgi:hypothetical protein